MPTVTYKTIHYPTRFSKRRTTKDDILPTTDEQDGIVQTACETVPGPAATVGQPVRGTCRQEQGERGRDHEPLPQPRLCVPRQVGTPGWVVFTRDAKRTRRASVLMRQWSFRPNRETNHSESMSGPTMQGLRSPRSSRRRLCKRPWSLGVRKFVRQAGMEVEGRVKRYHDHNDSVRHDRQTFGSSQPQGRDPRFG